MKLVTFAGAHACGKTAVILKTARLLQAHGMKAGVIKLDCISSDDDRVYDAAGIPNRKYLSGNICPDHFFAREIEEIFFWGHSESLDVLFTESAGLCGRCAPHISGVPAVCVIDCLSGITAPSKLGPMLRLADFIAVTKGDLVSPAEREVFLYHIRLANRTAHICFINGLSGQGAYRLSDHICRAGDTDSVGDRHLRFTMPSAVCTFCSGQTLIATRGPGGRIKRLPEGGEE